MTNSFTIQTILKSPCGNRNEHLTIKQKTKKIVKTRNDCPEVIWMHWNLKYWCIEKGIRLEKEYHFAPGRKLRADFALPDRKLLIEYMGLNSIKNGHTSLKGYTRDNEKMKTAVDCGYRMLYYTVLDYRNLLQDLEKIIFKSQ